MFYVGGIKSSGGKVTVEDKYEITLGDKNSTHPFYMQGSSKGFVINELQSPTLFLKRNMYYEFINTTDEPLYFTTDIAGGSNAIFSIGTKNKKNFTGISNGTVFLKVSYDLPNKFYYHSATNKYVGGIIIVV